MSWFRYKIIFGHISSLNLLSSCYPFTISLSLGKNSGFQIMDVLTWTKQHLKKLACVSHWKPPSLWGAGGEDHHLSFCTWILVCYRNPGVTLTLAMVRGEYNRWSLHWNSLSLYNGTKFKPSESGRTASASGPVSCRGPSWIWLGCAAAGAGCALSATNAVGCTAVFRGWWGGGDLLSSCCLPCS